MLFLFFFFLYFIFFIFHFSLEIPFVLPLSGFNIISFLTSALSLLFYYCLSNHEAAICLISLL